MPIPAPPYLTRPLCVGITLAAALASTPAPPASATLGNPALREAAMSTATAPPPESFYEPWKRVLAAYVDDEGLVDYAGLAAGGWAELEKFMKVLADANPDAFANDDERIAFWINAYNAVVIWQAVERYPIDSVRDVGALWGLVGGFFKNEYRVAGRDMSADDIEDGTLRANWSDTRIHWALVCAAFGCPRLLNRPYLASDLDDVLTERAREFLGQPRGLQLDRAANTVYLSSYFDWYAGDFEAESGDIVSYVLRYAPESDADFIRTHREQLRVRIMDYDWALNDQPSGPRSRRPVPR